MPGIRRIARIDLEAFATNVAGASSFDGRADAYGHSLALLAPVAADAGVREVLVSDERDAAVAASAGLVPVVGRLAPEQPDAAAPYGLVPGGRPVLTLAGEVLAVKCVPAGAGVSYGYTFRTVRPTVLALAGLGYADGVPRAASNRAHVAIGAQRLPLVGRIAMDQFVVDCGDLIPSPGDEVVLFGGEPGAPSPLEWAEATRRTPLALTAGLGSRIERVVRA